MTIDPAVLDALLAAGASAEMIVAAVKADAASEAIRAARQVPWDKLREMAFARDGNVCGYCATTDGPFEIDHVVPRANGGENTLDNVRVSCRSCNRAKRDREGVAWEELKERRARDRDRKRAKRGTTRNVRGQNGNSAEVADPLSPNDIYSNPLTPPLEISNEISPPSFDLQEPTGEPPLSAEEILEAWNHTADRIGLPKAKLTPQRRRKLGPLIRQHTLEDFTEAIRAVERSPFLRGENSRSWRADFDFFLQPSSFTKLIEGSYDRAH